MIVLAAACAYSQVELGDFQDAFEEFATGMAGSLAVNSTLGNNWSDAYVGKFPHLGVGICGGATFIGPDTTEKIFDSMEADVPSGLDKSGIPIPAINGTFKIGLPWLPMDIGIKGGFIPASVGKSLMDASGADLDYKSFGIQLRYALIKQGPGLKPNVSVGLAYNHLQGSVSVPSGMDSQDFRFEGTPYWITASEPKLAMDWKTNNIDITAQVSKKFLIFVPYLGAGLTLGKSTVEGGIDSKVETNYPGGLDALKHYLDSIGYDYPDISSDGFIYTADETSPLFRLYGGLSIRLLILDFDTQLLYLPATKSFGASLTTRLQF
jgi:hypothetical protein